MECDSSKSGEEKDEMTLPWMTMRVTPSGKPSKDAYHELFGHYNLGRAYAIVTMDSRTCFTICTIFTDVGYSPDITLMKADLDECMKASVTDVPLIALYLRLVGVKNQRTRGVLDPPISKSTYSYSHPNRPRVELGEFLAHANMLIVDRIEKKIERFEPGSLDSMAGIVKQRYEAIDRVIEGFILPLFSGYAYCPPLSFCPKGGPQADDYCAAWSFFYLHLRLINPKLSRRGIVKRMIEGKYLSSYMEVMKNTLDALATGSEVYGEYQRQRLRDLTREFSRRGAFEALERVIGDPDAFLKSAPDTKRALFWVKLLQGKSALVVGDGTLRYVIDGRIVA